MFIVCTITGCVSNPPEVVVNKNIPKKLEQEVSDFVLGNPASRGYTKGEEKLLGLRQMTSDKRRVNKEIKYVIRITARNSKHKYKEHDYDIYNIRDAGKRKARKAIIKDNMMMWTIDSKIREYTRTIGELYTQTEDVQVLEQAIYNADYYIFEVGKREEPAVADLVVEIEEKQEDGTWKKAGVMEKWTIEREGA